MNFPPDGTVYIRARFHKAELTSERQILSMKRPVFFAEANKKGLDNGDSKPIFR